MKSENIKVSKTELSAISRSLIAEHDKYNDLLYNQLEEAVYSESAFFELFCNLKKLYKLKNTEIAEYTGLSRMVISEMLEGEEKSQRKRYAVIKYLRSFIYCGTYSRISDYNFTKLLELLLKLFSPIINKQKLAGLMNISVNDISLILNYEKIINAESQRNILMLFYRLCSDPLNNSIEEYSAAARLLGKLLGRNIRIPEKRFICIYFTNCQADDEEIELAEFSGISFDDLHEILQGNGFPYYPKKLNVLFQIMSERFSERKLPDTLGRTDKFYLHHNGILKDNVHIKEEYEIELEKEEEARFKEIGDWFITLPDILREFVFKYALAQEKMNAYFFDYYISSKGGKKFYSFYFDKCKSDLILYIIELFRFVPTDEQEALLNNLWNKLSVSDMGVKAENYYSECAVMSFFFSSMAGNTTLSEKYRSAPVNNSLEAMLFMKNHYMSAWTMDFTGHDFLKKMLDFTANEWKLAAYIELSVIRNISVDFILEAIHEYFDDDFDEDELDEEDIRYMKECQDDFFLNEIYNEDDM